MPSPHQHVVAKATPPPAGLSIAEASKHLGISTHVLRVWEHRYGWPRPTRGPKGYRVYSPALIAILERVMTELQRGKTISDLLRDSWWQQVFETGRVPTPKPRAPAEPPWSTLPMPASALGRDVRERLRQALVAGDERMATWAQAMGQQLRPEEREVAVTAVMRMWEESRSVGR